VADRRYRWVHDSLIGAVQRSPARVGAAERVDGLLTHRVLGIPIFLAVMWLAFKIVTDVAAPFRDWVDATMSGPVSGWGRDLVAAVALGGTWVESLVVDGVVAGVGTVLTFVPILVALYVLLAVLEDTGYMARAAFVMDRVMRGLGLHGKSFLPLLVGFGCNVPAIYATRLLERRRDRVLTGLLVPFVSCAARLPVFVLLASVFFAGHRGTVVFAMYVLSLALVIAVGWVLSRTLLRDRDRVPFVLEIPPLRLPALRTVATATAQRTGAFLREAGTIILLVALGVWLLLAIPTGGGGFGTAAVADSALASASRAVSPVLAPAGLGSWEVTASLVSGVLAKEVVVSTMGQAYGSTAAEVPENRSVAADVGGIATGFGQAAADAVVAVPRVVGADFSAQDPPAGTLVSAVRTDLERSSGGHGALAALALMMFVLIYVPCMATVAAQYHELGAGWMAVSVVMNTALAWVLAVAVFQAGLLVGLG
jgi:ferrous iron transport protein B